MYIVLRFENVTTCWYLNKVRSWKKPKLLVTLHGLSTRLTGWFLPWVLKNVFNVRVFIESCAPNFAKSWLRDTGKDYVFFGYSFRDECFGKFWRSHGGAVVGKEIGFNVNEKSISYLRRVFGIACNDRRRRKTRAGRRFLGTFVGEEIFKMY